MKSYLLAIATLGLLATGTAASAAVPPSLKPALPAASLTQTPPPAVAVLSAQANSAPTSSWTPRQFLILATLGLASIPFSCFLYQKSAAHRANLLRQQIETLERLWRLDVET